MKNLTNNKLLIAYITLLVLNAICLIILTKRAGAFNLDGSYSAANSSGLIMGALSGLIISVPLLCAVLSAILALFVDRQQRYGNRFTRMFLLMVVTFYILAFFRFLVILLT